MRQLYVSIPGVTQVISVNMSNSHTSQVGTATVECLGTTLDIGDPISIDLGYTDDHAVIFTGFVKQIDETEPPLTKTIVASDVLIRASDFFIVTTNPTTPLKVSNRSPESIIAQLLGYAGLTSFDYDSSSYIWGVSGPITIDLVSSYDYSRGLADLIAWQLWADKNGVVHFKDRRPYPMGGDSSVGTIYNTDLISIKNTVSDKNLRNKAVVWGTPGIYAEASAVSPYLPSGYYRTAIVSSYVIDSQWMAQTACDFNLEVYNRLDRGYSTTVFGNPHYNARDVAYYDNIAGQVYIYSCEHNWSNSGYITNMELRIE